MILFETVCRGNHKNAWTVFWIFIGLAVLGFLAMNFEIGRPIIAQLVLLVSLIAAAYVQIRFIATAFLYQAIREDEGDFLVISRKQGRKCVGAAKLSLAHLRWLTRVDTRVSPAPTVEGVPVCNYSAHLFADAYALAFFDDGADKVLLRINADEPFLAALEAYLPFEEDASEEKQEENEENKS